MVGYCQLAFTGAGFAITMIYGVQMLYWYGQNFSRLQNPDDPSASMSELWSHIKLPLLGLALFAVATFWAFVTSCMIVAQSRAEENLQKAMAPLPPPKIRVS
jgi:hypothetical protein